MENISKIGMFAPCNSVQKSIFFLPFSGWNTPYTFGLSFQAQSNIHLLLCSESLYDTN